MELRRTRMWLAALLILNACDTAVTLYVLQNGLGTELNPLMACLYEISPVVFAAFKLGIVGVWGWWIWHDRELAVAQGALHFVTILYFALVLYETIVLGWILWN